MGYRIKGLWDQGLEGWNDRSEVWDLRIQRDEVWDLKSIIDQGLEGWGLENQRDQTQSNDIWVQLVQKWNTIEPRNCVRV